MAELVAVGLPQTFAVLMPQYQRCSPVGLFASLVVAVVVAVVVALEPVVAHRKLRLV